MTQLKEQQTSLSNIVLEGNLKELFQQILSTMPPHLTLAHNSPLNQLSEYLRTGEIWVLAGASGSGKSTFALNLIHDILQEYQDSSCAWISLDDSQHIFCERIKKTYDNHDWLNRLIFLPKLDPTAEGLAEVCTQLRGQKYFIVLDYLQQVAMGKDSPRIIIDHLLLMMKSIIQAGKQQNIDITFLLLSQTTEHPSNTGKPVLRLKESEGIFQQANLVMSIHTTPPPKESLNSKMTLTINKNKSGKAGGEISYTMTEYTITKPAKKTSNSQFGKQQEVGTCSIADS